MKLMHLGIAVFWAIGSLYLSGCATTCDTLQISKQTLANERVRVTFKCKDKTVEATIKKAPACLDACWKPAK